MLVELLNTWGGAHVTSDFVRIRNSEQEHLMFLIDPYLAACWRMGEPAPYLHLARTFDLVEQESGRLRTVDMLCNMFRRCASILY
jgi:hypothetical protein